MLHAIFKAALAASAIGALAVTSAVPAAADGKGHGGKWHGGEHRVAFSDLDADGDGQLTQEELASAKQVWLGMHDADGDGALSKEEMLAAAMQMANEAARMMTEHMFERQDDNGDGLISTDELGGRKISDRMFNRMDSDDDGMISESEYSADGHKRGKGWHKGHKHRR